jgi:hypothetical protein
VSIPKADWTIAAPEGQETVKDLTGGLGCAFIEGMGAIFILRRGMYVCGTNALTLVS